MSLSPRRQNDTDAGIDDIFSYMCSLAVAKCAKKADKKRASCGGAAMRKRLLIKNFVTQMLDQERQMTSASREQLSREVNMSGCRLHFIAAKNQNKQTQLNGRNQELIREGLGTKETRQGVNASIQKISKVLPDTIIIDDDEPEEGLEDDEEVAEFRMDDSINKSIINARNILNKRPHLHPSLLSIAGLDLESPRSFAASPYLTAHDSILTMCGDDPIDPDDELSPETIELFGPRSSLTGANCLKQAPPSWQDPETDLFMLERSTPSLYYDEYPIPQSPTASNDSYGMSYRHEDFHTNATLASAQLVNDPYSLPTTNTEPTNYMISGSNASNTNAVHSATYNESARRHPQFPENFMDDSSDNDAFIDASAASLIASTTTLSSLVATATYAELQTSNLLAKVKALDAHFESTGSAYTASHCDFTGLDSLEDKARSDEEQERGNTEDERDEEDEPQTIVASAFVDFINMVPSTVKFRRAGDCRTEALHDSYFGQSRHITDLDTQITLVEDDEFVLEGQHHYLQTSHQLMVSDTKLSGNMLEYEPLSMAPPPMLADLINTPECYTTITSSTSPVSGAQLHGGVSSPPRKRLNQRDYNLVLTTMAPKRLRL